MKIKNYIPRNFVLSAAMVTFFFGIVSSPAQTAKPSITICATLTIPSIWSSAIPCLMQLLIRLPGINRREVLLLVMISEVDYLGWDGGFCC